MSTPAACVNGPLANTGSQDCLGIGQLVWLHVVAASDALVEAWVKGGAEHAVACLASSHQSKRTTAGTCIILTSSSKEASLGKAPHTPDGEAQHPSNHHPWLLQRFTASGSSFQHRMGPHAFVLASGNLGQRVVCLGLVSI